MRPVCLLVAASCQLAVLVLLIAATTTNAQVNVVHPLPPQAPAWLDGFQVRWPVRTLGLASEQPARTVIVSIPTGGWLRPDAADVAVQGPSGAKLPFVVLAHDPLGDTVVQFQREGNENWYWVYGVNPTGTPLAQADPKKDSDFHEGISLEVRSWTDGSVKSWPEVREGLDKNKVLGNGIVTEVVQTCNPARPDIPHDFAVSYRGYFKVDKAGTYRFFLNADGASFLFVDGFKVYDRPGNNRTYGAKMKLGEIDALSGKVDLKPGVHSFEVHQAVTAQVQGYGVLALTWSPVGEKKFVYLPQSAMAHPLYARVAAAEFRPGNEGVFFVHGFDDSVEVAGLKLMLVRFEAHGHIKDPTKIVWDMGDGTKRTGKSLSHVYFKEGDYDVSVEGGALAPFRRRYHLWAEPGEMSPLSLEHAVTALADMEWSKLPGNRVREIFNFLQVCEQANRWPLLDNVAKFLLEQKDPDPELRSQLYVARMDALVKQGRAAEALRLGEQATAELAKIPALAVRVQLATAGVHHYHFKDFTNASKIYKAILDDNSRVEHPNLRLAGVRWGDLFAESGDLARASETYRIASTLGGDKFAQAGADVTTRGALLRIAEQKLKTGDILQTRFLLQRLELEYPGRRLDGVYCFLRAESDRLSGRYDEALRHYEQIFKLPQWAGYKDRATYGIADSYFRMGDMERARTWFGNLKEAFPKFYEAQKGKEIEKIIEVRLDRLKSQGKEILSSNFRTGFEPGESDPWGETGLLSVVRAPGMDGPYCLYCDVGPGIKVFDWERPIKNLVPGGLYWVEVWYKEVIHVPPPLAYQKPFIAFHLLFPGMATTDGLSNNTEAQHNMHQQWHKLSVKLRAPLEQDFRMRFRFNNVTGAYLYDRVSVRPVTDPHLDALVNFLESGKTP